MKIESIFPHPIAEVKLNIDCDQVLTDMYEVLGGKSDNESGWDCDVLTTFNDEHLNYEFGKRQYNLLSQIEYCGQQFLREMGWMKDVPENLVHWWFNIYQNEHWQEWHHHGRHSVCAILYLTNDAVPTLFLNPNDYTFHSRHGMEESLNESNKLTAKHHKVFPEAGKLVLFPGYMFHTVPYKNSKINVNYKQHRVTMACNFEQTGHRLIDDFKP